MKVVQIKVKIFVSSNTITSWKIEKIIIKWKKNYLKIKKTMINFIKFFVKREIFETQFTVHEKNSWWRD